MSTKQKEFLKHHHQCVQTLCNVGLCDKSALKRKGLLQLLYLLHSAQIIDKSYYQSLFDCIEQIKESELTGHYCGANASCSREWKEIIDAFAEAVVELKDFNIKVSRHPSKLPPFTSEMLDKDFDMYTIAAFQKTPDESIVDNPDFLRAKDLHFRVKRLFENIKQKFPELQRQQISILTPPAVVFKPEPKNPFLSTADMGHSGETNFDGADIPSRLTITKLDENFDETPRLRSVTSLPTLNNDIPTKADSFAYDTKKLFRPSTFDKQGPDRDLDRDSIDELMLPPTLPANLSKSLFKKKRSKSSLPWWWKSSTAKKPKRKKTKKKRKISKKKKSPKKKRKNASLKKDETKKITIHTDKDTISRLRELNGEKRKSSKKKRSPKRKSRKSRTSRKSSKKKRSPKHKSRTSSKKKRSPKRKSRTSSKKKRSPKRKSRKSRTSRKSSKKKRSPKRKSRKSRKSSNK